VILDGPLLSLDAASALLGISPRTLRRLAACGAIPVRRMGRLILKDLGSGL
jgi:excisionase family DNA binding protein